MSFTRILIPSQYSDKAHREIIQGIFKLIQVLLSLLYHLIVDTIPSPYNPQKYHTSILSRHAWILELITGHPDCIWCELGLIKEFFLMLIAELCDLGHQNSHKVMLEEQMAIFLYMCRILFICPSHLWPSDPTPYSQDMNSGAFSLRTLLQISRSPSCSSFSLSILIYLYPY